MSLARDQLFKELFSSFLEINSQLEAVIVSDHEGFVIAGEKKLSVNMELISVLTALINPILERIRDEFAFRKFGTASLSCSVLGDCVDTDANELFDFGNEDFTIEKQIQKNGNPSSSEYTFGQANSSLSTLTRPIIGFVLTDGSYRVIVVDESGTSYTITSNDLVTDNNFHHLAIERYNGVITIYIDGSPQLDTINIGINPLVKSNNKFSI